MTTASGTSGGSPFFRSLRADERWVVIEMLLAARYAEGGEFWFAGQRHPLAPGQFIETEQQIADAAGVGRKTVRTVRRKARNAGLLSSAKVSAAGHCPSVTTILDYGRIRLGAKEAGPLTGTAGGTVTGTPGGHQGALSEQGNPENTGTREPLRLVPAPSAAARRGRKPSTGVDPRKAVLRDLWERLFQAERQGEFYRWQGAKDEQGLSQLVAVSVEDFEARALRGLRGQGFLRCSTVAQLSSKWNDLAGGSSPGPNLPASTARDFTKADAYQPVSLRRAT
jgi:hypothetical protein